MLRSLVMAVRARVPGIPMVKPPLPLTARQRQVLGGYARGLATKEIAAELGLSEATVKTHLARACERLGARSRAQAVARYVGSLRR